MVFKITAHGHTGLKFGGKSFKDREDDLQREKEKEEEIENLIRTMKRKKNKEKGKTRAPIRQSIFQPKRKRRKIEENQSEFIVVGLPSEEKIPEITKRKTEERDGRPNMKKRRKNDFMKMTEKDEHPVQIGTVMNEDTVVLVHKNAVRNEDTVDLVQKNTVRDKDTVDLVDKGVKKTSRRKVGPFRSKGGPPKMRATLETPQKCSKK